MKNAAKLKYFSILAALVLASCTPTTDGSLKSPNEDGGLEGNQDQDKVEKQTTETLCNFLKEVGKNEFYSYDVQLTSNGQVVNHFKNYFTPNAFYEHNDNFEQSVGYAQNKNKEVFKFYLDENLENPTSSVFLYSGEDGITKIKDLYNPIETITSFTFLSYSMDDFSAEYISGNKFLITDSVVGSIFQFMTSYGTSITSYVTAIYVEIIDTEKMIFRSTVDLGSLGSVIGTYTKNDCAPLFPVNSIVVKGEFDGIEYHNDVKKFFDTARKNNYKIEGIFEKLSAGQQTNYAQNYYCTEDYFYIEYLGDYAKSYKNWGYVMVPANTEITYYDFIGGVKDQTHTLKLEYDACFRFSEYDGELVFDQFKGPIQGDYKYVKVDELPAKGSPDTLYIVFNKETGENDVYNYIQDAEGNYYFSYFSNWFDNVGDFYINDFATFYLGSSAVGEIGEFYFEKDLQNENTYHSKDSSIISSLAHGLFGWGWNPTNTWMDYAIKASLTLNKNGEDIVSADIGMEVETTTGIKEIYYTLKDFGTTSVSKVEAFLAEVL